MSILLPLSSPDLTPMLIAYSLSGSALTLPPRCELLRLTSASERRLILLNLHSSLLGISALAGSGQSSIPRHHIILLPLLFTGRLSVSASLPSTRLTSLGANPTTPPSAGMTLVDSLDSIFMLHAYALPSSAASASTANGKASWRHLQFFETEKSTDDLDGGLAEDEEERLALIPRLEASRDEMLDVSVVLTVISITVALLISIVGAPEAHLFALEHH